MIMCIIQSVPSQKVQTSEIRYGQPQVQLDHVSLIQAESIEYTLWTHVRISEIGRGCFISFCAGLWRTHDFHTKSWKWTESSLGS